MLDEDEPGFFDRADHAGRLAMAHDVAEKCLQWNREELWKALSKFKNLQTIEVDLTNAYCPVGCCRVMELEWEMLKSGVRPKLFRMLGLRTEAEIAMVLEGIRSTGAELMCEPFEIRTNPEDDPWEGMRMRTDDLE
jgi:hypothetical protein